MSTEKLYSQIREAILGKLAAELAPDLFYHCLEHTMDVEEQAERIALHESISLDKLFLLKLACLYHDTGFLATYSGHEIAGCTLARRELAGFGITGSDLDTICGMIMATRIPQTPLNKLEEIICDADLDYLGRDDFPRISHNLFRELKVRNIIKSENDWNLVQINFFNQHTYFTATTRSLRDPQKRLHLEMIKRKINPA